MDPHFLTALLPQPLRRPFSLVFPAPGALLCPAFETQMPKGQRRPQPALTEETGVTVPRPQLIDVGCVSRDTGKGGGCHLDPSHDTSHYDLTWLAGNPPTTWEAY